MSEANVFIPISDGTRLPASLYLPATEGPWPAPLETRPYRKDAGEYRPQEHDDLCEVIAWLTRQPWSTSTFDLQLEVHEDDRLIRERHSEIETPRRLQ